MHANMIPSNDLSTGQAANFSGDSTYVHLPETSVNPDFGETYRDWLDAKFLEEVAATEEALLPFYGFKDRAKYDRYRECRSNAFFARSRSTGQIKVMGSSCRDRWCLHCARSRAKEVSAQIADWLRTVKHPRMLTMTLKHSNAPLNTQVDNLYKMFRKWRLRKDVKKNIVAGVWCTQIKRSDRTGEWHPHLHCLIIGKFMDKSWYRQTWLEVTGDSHVVRIDYIKDKEKAADYVGRYVARPTMLKSYKLLDRLEIMTTCKSRRLFGTWGRKSARPVLKRKEVDVSDWQKIAAWTYIFKTKDSDERSRRIWRAWLTGKPISEEECSICSAIEPKPPNRTKYKQHEIWETDGPLSRNHDGVFL